MARFSRSIALVVCGAALASCSLTSLDGFSEPPSAAAGDGGDDGANTSSTETGVDAGVDSGMDAGVDTGSPDADAGPFCASRTDSTFCEDFDVPSRPPLPVTRHGGGVDTIDSNAALSAPNALRIDLGPSTTDGDAQAYRTMTMNVTTLPHQVVLEWAIRLDEVASASISAASIAIVQGSNRYEAVVDVGASDLLIEQTFTSAPPASVAHSVPQNRRVQLGTWTRLKMDLTRAGSSWKATLSRDGEVSLADVPLSTWDGISGADSVVFAVGGLYSTASPTPLTFRFDDLAGLVVP
ncbi:hypothetical protein [Labilithrix luteola]|nr:hypothetical protein [Labilithrix luteola]